jgi:arginine decarboxylase
VQVSRVIPPTAALPAKPTKPKTRPSWTPEKSAELYGVETWGHGFFGVNDYGHVTVKLADKHGDAHVSLHNVIEGLRDLRRHLIIMIAGAV